VYYIDPNGDGIYQAIKFVTFNGSDGYYYLTDYVGESVVLDTDTINANTVYYYDNACTVRAYFKTDFNTSNNGKINNTNFTIYTETITYPAIDNSNEIFNRGTQYYIDNAGNTPIVIEEYSANKYYIKHTGAQCSASSGYAHYILATASAYDASKAPYYKTVVERDLNYDGTEFYHIALDPVTFDSTPITDCYVYTTQPCYRIYDDDDYERYDGFN